MPAAAGLTHRRGCLRGLAALGVASVVPAQAGAVHTLTPGQSLTALLAQAADGDIVELLPGEHRGQVAVILQRRLTLRGVAGVGGARPVLQADGRDAEGKAILVVRDGDIRIQGLEFRGARVPDGNGAGIRFERGRLLVQDCAFIDNENGILTANFADAELSVQDSRFADAPLGARLPHLLYVGRIARFTLSGSHFSGGAQGHLVKSRARVNQVLHNRLDDRPEGQAAYELEFPNGGMAWVLGNVIGQSRHSSNPTLLAFGAEGSDDRPQGLLVAHNTFISEGLRPAVFVRVHERLLPVPVLQRIVNNLFAGLGVGDFPWDDRTRGNVLLPHHVLDDGPEPRLAQTSLWRGRAIELSAEQGQWAQPTAEPALPLGVRTLRPRQNWSPGAYQD